MTVQKALGILSSIGVAETVNGRGRRAALGRHQLQSQLAYYGSFRRDLEVFVDALQMLCILLPPSLTLAAARIDAVARDVGRTPFGGGDVLSAQRAIMESLLANVQLAPLQTILRELNGLVEWGCFRVLRSRGREHRSAASAHRYGARLPEGGRRRRIRPAPTDYYRTFLAAVPAFLERWGASGMKAVAIP